TSGPATSRAGVNQLNLSARLTWAPTDRSGIEYQVNGYTFQRDGLSPLATGSTSPAFPGVDVHRSDMFVHAFAATRSDGMGLRFDALLGSSSFGDSTHLHDTLVSTAAFDASLRERAWSAEAWARVRDGRWPLDVGSRLAVSPMRWLTLAGTSRLRTLL